MDPLLRSAFGEARRVRAAPGPGRGARRRGRSRPSLLATRISRPIDDLAAASRRVARGDYAQRVPPATGELGELAASFNEMAATLEATEQRRRDLIGDIAHELRTPIASVRGYVEGLEAGVFEPGPDAWRVLDEQTARLAHLVDDLAVLWRAESRDLRLDRSRPWTGRRSSPTPASATARSPSERSIELSLGRVAAASVRADRTRIGQVLDNLVGNALRYTPPGGHVSSAWPSTGRRPPSRSATTAPGSPRTRRPACSSASTGPIRHAPATPAAAAWASRSRSRSSRRWAARSRSRARGPATGPSFTVRLPRA